jgi:hypothetical protein
MPRVALRCSAITLIGLLTLHWPLGSAQADTPKIDFSHDVAPIIRARCAECHTDGTYKGSFSLDTRAAMLESEAVVPGKPDQSELLARVTSHDPEEHMPPPEKKPLAAREVELLRRWVAEGAAWQEGYSFKHETYVAPLKPRRVTVPPARPGLEHPIDRILAPYYASHQVTPPSELDDAAFLRRLDLDFIGLLPAPDELAAFQRDTSPGKRNRQVRSALDDRRAYADHWFTFWNDMLRNEQGGIGTRENGRKPVSAWLYQALLDNKPYDVFARELLSPTPDSEGFIHGIQWRGRVNASQTRDVQFSQNVSQVFFGINMKCASCHDSFIDTWKLADAYGLAAITAEKPLEIYRCDHPTGKMAEARFLWPELGSIDPSAPRAKRLEQLAALTTHPDNGRFQRTIVNRIWQRLMGRGIVQPVDVMANRPWNEDLLDYLAGYLVEQHYDLQKLLEHIATSRAYQSQAAIYDEEPAAADFVFHGPELKRMTAEQFLDAISMITGTAPAKKLFPVKQPAASRKDRDFLRSSLVALDPLLRSLGRPNPEQIVTTRPDQLTTLQALDLTNGQILSEMLARGAANLLKSDPQITGSAMIDTIYDRALSRRPTHDEQATALEIVGDKPTTESLSDLLWAVFMLPEFQLIR